MQRAGEGGQEAAVSFCPELVERAVRTLRAAGVSLAALSSHLLLISHWPLISLRLLITHWRLLPHWLLVSRWLLITHWLLSHWLLMSRWLVTHFCGGLWGV